MTAGGQPRVNKVVVGQPQTGGQYGDKGKKNKQQRTKESTRRQAMLNTHRINPFKYDMNQILETSAMDPAKASSFLASVIAKASRVSTRDAKDFVKTYLDSGDLTKDEVDKIGADYKGDPASALLEVLDPEQNKDFTDHYLEVPFDLSKVMFITTANTTSTIPRPLLDRMEVLEVSGYTEEDKLQIAEKYLVPKQVKENGLTKSNISFTETGLRTLINYYTRESGVRNLEREIGNLCRKVAKNVVCGDTKKVSITGKKVQELLGKKRFRFDIIKGETEVGVTTGLAWTVVGGDTLFIETTAVPGNGKLVLTGQMGDVMQESAKAGLSYIRSVSKKLKIDEDFYKKYDLHVHIPEGAIPKDGPSAGVTMCTAIISTLTGIPVRKDIAMTGEITLRGKVLPVGGIREKVMAAHRAGIRKVLLPAENDVDIQDIPEVVRNDMEFVLLRNVDDALKEVLVKDKKNEDK